MRTRTRLGSNIRPVIEALEDRTVPSVNLVESEPNNTPATADVIDRLPSTQVIVSGEVNSLGDRDWFRLDLRAGDVIGAAARGQGSLNPSLRLLDSAGRLLFANDDVDTTSHPGWGQTYLPDESPLPSAHIKTDAEVSYVVSTSGTYFLEASASGDASTGRYEMDTMVARPGLESKPAGTRQVLFLDFDGANVDFNHFPDKDSGGPRQLSPLSSFLPAWGLTPADENAVIDAILARVTASLSTSAQTNGLNDNFGILILNSRDYPDRFGIDPLVSRVVVGGTAAEAHFRGDTVGTSQDIDVGNFKTDDEAVATLDFINGGLALPNHRPDQVVDFVALGAATLILHEAGHIFGCFHTEPSSGGSVAGDLSLMDPGMGPILTSSLGPDGLFGTSDDLELRYSVDAYSTEEPYRGQEDTLNTIAFGLSVGTAGARAAVSPATAGKLRGSLPAEPQSGGDAPSVPIVQAGATRRGTAYARPAELGSATLQWAWGLTLRLSPSAGSSCPSDLTPADSPEASTSGEWADGFSRLFGDSDGDGDVDGQERDRFRAAFHTSAGGAGYLWYFDFDGDGDVDGLDNGQFNRRFGQ